MAFEKIGLGGVLEFNSRNAVTGMSRANHAFGRLRGSASGIGRAAGMAAVGVAGLGVVTAPLAMIAKGAAEQYAAFDQALATLSSVSGVSKEALDAQRKSAMALGSETKFTATEILGGYEKLARAGFKQEEQLGAIKGVTSLAAAENLKLADSAQIVTDVIRGFGLPATAAGDAADMIAFAAGNSKTNITEMGQAFRYSIGRANDLNMNLSELSATLGIMADGTLRGSTAGTALDNMFRSIQKPSEEAEGFLAKYNIRLREANGEFVGMQKLMGGLNKGFSDIQDPNKRDRMKQVVLGTRGARAFNAIQVGEQNGKGGLSGLHDGVMNDSSGEAERRAAAMLNSLSGQVTLLKSASEGFVIRFFDEFKGMDGSFIAPLVSAVQNFNKAWDAATEMAEEFGAISSENADKLEAKFGPTIAGMVLGVRDGIQGIRDGISYVSGKFQEFGVAMEDTLGREGVRKLTKFATMFMGLAVGSTPFIAALLGIAFVVSTVVVPAMSALATAVSAAFWPVLIGAALVGAAYMALRDENESFAAWSVRMWGAIKVAAIDFYETALKPMFQAIAFAASVLWPAIESSASQAFASLRQALNEFVELWNVTFGQFNIDWQMVGVVIAVTAAIITNTFVKVLGAAFDIAGNTVRDFRGIIESLFDGDILGGLGKLAQFIGNTLLLPIRLASSAIAALLESVMSIPGAETLLGGDSAFMTKAIKQMKDFGAEGVQLGLLTNKENGATIDLRTAAAGDHVKNIGERPDAPAEGAFLDRIKRAKAIEDENRELRRQNENKRRDEEMDMKREQNARAKRMEAKGCETNLHLDGKKVAQNQARHSQDLSDRMGFKTPPFVRRTSAEQGRV